MEQSQDRDETAINTIRTLSMDAVQAANSGHPGTPMALAPVMYTLWQDFLRFDPKDPRWPNRDRFVLSAGHASMLLYSTLHLAGVSEVSEEGEITGRPAVSLDEIRRFRQIDSKTPGHPEYRLTSGIETTTGPLGQGCATSVGLAMASRWLAARYNRPGFAIFDYNVYVICSDGDLMEGIASEAASLAAHLGLGNLCWVYDSNRISIEGSTELAFTEDVAARFAAYGWNIGHVADANDRTELRAALAAFDGGAAKPTFLVVKSHIGYGAPKKQDTKEAHGEPLGADEIRGAKKFYGWPEESQFLVPDGVYETFDEGVGRRGRAAREESEALFVEYAKTYPDLADELRVFQHRDLPDNWDADIPLFPADAKGMAGRDASAQVLNAIAKNVPWIIGGSADLAPSTKTRLTFEGAGDFEAGDHSGRNLHFGIREHAMGAIVNGLAISKLRPYGSGFLIFSDYARPAIRLSAIMEIPSLHIFTHDSIGVGEDGPTHQPVEHLASLRAIPGLVVMRPGDANEIAEAWRVIMTHHDPVALILSRQAMPTFDRTVHASAEGVRKGAYVLAGDPAETPEVILMGTGTEVGLCVQAYALLIAEGIRARVVSMPSWEMFERQDAAYKESVLPKAVRARVAVEQASTLGWERYTGDGGKVIGMHTFGASAPLKDLLTKFGFTPDKVATTARELVRGN